MEAEQGRVGCPCGENGGLGIAAEQRGFAVHPRRWVVERTLAWLTAHRRLARDYEHQPEVSEAIIRWAAINGILRRITRGHPTHRQRRRTFTWP